jgi:hypothetical protein
MIDSVAQQLMIQLRTHCGVPLCYERSYPIPWIQVTLRRYLYIIVVIPRTLTVMVFATVLAVSTFAMPCHYRLAFLNGYRPFLRLSAVALRA